MGAEHIYAVDYIFEFNDTEFVVWAHIALVAQGAYCSISNL